MKPLPMILILSTLLLSVVLLRPPPVYPAAPGPVVLSEIAWAGTTASANDEWLELFNPTAAAINLSGWTLTAADGTPTLTLSGTIPAGGFYLLERTDETTVPGVAADQLYSGALGNGGEDLILRDATSALVDRVDASAGWFAGHAAGRARLSHKN